MLHNLTPQPQVVYITYDVDYLPASSPLASGITPVKPIWMDVQNGSAYPVFDVHQNTGSTTGCGYLASGTPTATPKCFTYPADAQNPYGGGPAKNEWTAPQAGTLVFGLGHLHPGGLSDTLTLTRGANTVGLFNSQADYYDPGGPISWDMAMTVTPPSWRVGIQPGDKLSIQATYDTSRASWYEDMGIMILWEAVGQSGPDPFTNPPPTTGLPTHGHLAEASNHGGPDLPSPDPAALPDGQTLDNQIGIAGFEYLPGNAGLPSTFQNPPTVHPGQTLQFDNFDSAEQIFHTVTACKDPCNGPTGISYPIANGPVEFDSKELGYGPTGLTAASNSSTWTIPANLPPGTYTYFCRIHPFMRGAFRVLPH
jgi:plastocyanin